MGDTEQELREVTGRFFVAWDRMIRELLEEAKSQGKLRADVDTGSLSQLVISALEGSLILFKVIEDPEALYRTRDALKSVISCYRV